jgi:AraC family transcriptional regulator
MQPRIMMQVGSIQRPLSFDGVGRMPPLLNSASTPWAGLPVEVHRMQSLEPVGKAGPLDGERGVLIFLDGRMQFELGVGNRRVRRVSTAGSASLLCGEQRSRVFRMEGQATAVALHLPIHWLQRMAGSDEVARGFSRPAHLGQDETLCAITKLMCEEIRRGAPNGELYAESLSMSALSYLAQRLSCRGSRERDAGRLSREQCRRLRDYIMGNLHEPISNAQLAGRVGVSERHVLKLFRQAYGTTPHRYVQRLRLAEGARLLAQPGHDIADIALQVGFCDQSHFTMAFRRAFGVTPRRYALQARAHVARS